MRALELVHKQIIAGNVLGPSGTWIPCTAALKQKRSFLKHVFNGEVEIDGKWVNLSSVSSIKKKPAKETPTTPNTISSEDLRTLKKNISQSEQLAKKTISPLMQTSNEQKTVILPSPGKILSTSGHSGQNHTQPPLKDIAQNVYHPIIKSSENYSPSEKSSVPIKTISLGKGTVLTISESRAGDALVAICSIQGFIDQTNAGDLNTEIMSMLDFGVRFFIIDFEQTNLIGSAGWGVLAVASRFIKGSQGFLVICSMSQEIEESFYILQFNEVIEARKTMYDCLESIKSIISNPVKVTTDTKYYTTNEPLHFFGESYDDLPLHEKIKSIISHNGPVGFFTIKKMLENTQYGNIKLNSFRLYLILKELNLESKWKRVRFFRSC